jgi:hypothetical protein
MWNGNSAYSNSNSFDDSAEARTLPWWFRAAMPVPVTLVSGT